VEYALAGHLPILHYRADSRTVEPLTCAQFPLGFFEDATYTSGHVARAGGDLFLLVSDGIVETTNRADEQFGMARVAEELRSRASSPLEEIVDAIIRASAAHGVSEDDRSMLVVRVLV
jgi:phosphoserine phosphatase RsbU/P